MLATVVIKEYIDLCQLILRIHSSFSYIISKKVADKSFVMI